MEWDEIAVVILLAAFALVGVALIWLVLELVLTVRSARKTVGNLQQRIEPTLSNLEEVTCAMKPIVAKVDPLVERVSLTVDAANLEIMRFDQILENVTDITETTSEITSSLSSAVDAIDAISNAPLDLVNSVSGKVRHVFKQKKASDTSVALGSKEEEKAALPFFEGRKRVPKHAAADAADTLNLSAAQQADAAGAAETTVSEGDTKSFAGTSSGASNVGAFRFGGASTTTDEQYFTYAAAPSSDVSAGAVPENASEDASWDIFGETSADIFEAPIFEAPAGIAAGFEAPAETVTSPEATPETVTTPEVTVTSPTAVTDAAATTDVVSTVVDVAGNLNLDSDADSERVVFENIIASPAETADTSDTTEPFETMR